ncbi:16S rRNA (cytosine(1402)-N(4))-methyltransferase RsmH [Sulfurivirga sp.]|uniref:16S rRNA (cytosine(1402)-N(4))-methyltransferase RsmH n=1 Tax=Sulfurivirga sp. TaxID=2614236 RepID=UPI0025E458D0|nr:16S rRNA (cytosine(1402)-N(4))-methyltransferase RsmH [Sulfurivirga sp.]
MEGAHYPVMLSEALEGLNVRPDGIYVDGTFGRGGHSRAILDRLGADGRLLAFDRDPEAVAWARQRVDDPRFEIVHGSFTALADEVARRGWTGRIAGVLLDLGVSSPQLDARERGFSFLRDGPLDMRMNPAEGVSARQWLAEVDRATLARVLKEYGEERFSGRIARAIKEAVEAGGLHTTGELARLIETVVPRREKGKHPATRTFQAIRIAVNGELEALKAVLPQAVEVLRTGGRLVAISFHSLEDRLVKRFIRALSRGETDPFGREVSAPRLKPVGRAVFPSEAEVAENPRSRSAVMRVAERI